MFQTWTDTLLVKGEWLKSYQVFENTITALYEACKPEVLVQDWFKDSQTRLAVRDEVGAVLDEFLPDDGYDKDLFVEKRDKIFELTLDLVINHRKWAA